MEISAETFNSAPVIMSITNHDPSGSSGIQADIETTASLGCHCTSVISSLCAKDTQETKDIIPVDSSLVIEQARAILEDIPVKAIKIGFLGSVENIEAVHSILHDYNKIPVVLDPASRTHFNEHSEKTSMAQAIKNLLLPFTAVATLDLTDAYDLSHQSDTLDACAQEILESGCQQLLITDTTRNPKEYENQLYSQSGLIRDFSWERIASLPYGCSATLSTAITCYIAHGLPLELAIEQGQQFSWHCLANSRRVGMGNHIPNRFYWTDKDHRRQKKQILS